MVTFQIGKITVAKFTVAPATLTRPVDFPRILSGFAGAVSGIYRRRDLPGFEALAKPYRPVGVSGPAVAGVSRTDVRQIRRSLR